MGNGLQAIEKQILPIAYSLSPVFITGEYGFAIALCLSLFIRFDFLYILNEISVGGDYHGCGDTVLLGVVEGVDYPPNLLL